MQPGAQPALRRGFEPQIAALAVHEVARDGEAEAEPARVGVARRVEAVKGAEHVLALLFGDAGSVVVDQDVESVARLDPRDPDMAAVAPRIADKVREAAPRRVGPQQQAAAPDRDRRPSQG